MDENPVEVYLDRITKLTLNQIVDRVYSLNEAMDGGFSPDTSEV